MATGIAFAGEGGVAGDEESEVEGEEDEVVVSLVGVEGQGEGSGGEADV